MLLKYKGRVVARLSYAKGLLATTRGLMLRKRLPEGHGIIMSLNPDKQYSVHMLFMRFPIDVLVLNTSLEVLSTHTLTPWRDIIKISGARWIIELNAGVLEQAHISPEDYVELLENDE